MPSRVKVSDYVCSRCNRNRRGMQWASTRYNRSAKRRACQHRYSHSPKGRAYCQRRNALPEYKAGASLRMKWARNPLGMFKEVLGLNKISRIAGGKWHD